MPYADDLRQKLLHAVDTNALPRPELVRVFGISLTDLHDLLRRRAQAGVTHALPHGCGPPFNLNARQQTALREYVLAHPHLRLHELGVWLQPQYQMECSVSGLCRLLQRLDLPRKKGLGTPANATRRLTSRRAPTGVPH